MSTIFQNKKMLLLISLIKILNMKKTLIVTRITKRIDFGFHFSLLKFYHWLNNTF